MSIKVLKTTFTASSEDIDRLFACNRISAMIWNETLRLAKEYSLSNGSKWAGKSYLQEQTKNRYPLQSQSVQSVVHRYLFARDGARAAISKGYKNKYPWRHKNHYNTRWVDKAFDFDFIKNILSLSLGIWDHKKQKPILVMLPKDTVGKLKELLEKNKNAKTMPIVIGFFATVKEWLLDNTLRTVINNHHHHHLAINYIATEI